MKAKFYTMIGRTKYEQIMIAGVCVMIEQIKRARAGSRSCERIRRVLVSEGSGQQVTFQVSNFSGIPGFYIFPSTTAREVVYSRKGALAVGIDLNDVAKICAEEFRGI